MDNTNNVNDNENNSSSNSNSVNSSSSNSGGIGNALKMSENKSPELCKKGCGFYGNEKTRGLCSSCYNKVIKEENEEKNKAPKRSIYDIENEILGMSSSPNRGISMMSTSVPTMPSSHLQQMMAANATGIPSITTTSAAGTTTTNNANPTTSTTSPSTSPMDIPGRPSQSQQAGSIGDISLTPSPTKSGAATCSFMGCNKKLVGIMQTSTKCRCGSVFCAKHMHNHNCTFDYKAMAKSTISKANPQIVGNKIVKL